MDTLLSRMKDEEGDFVMKHMPESGMILDHLEVVDVTNIDGELSFPESRQNSEMFENLTLSGSEVHSKNNKNVFANLVFHNDKHVVLLHEQGDEVIAESWKKQKRFFRNHNEVVRVPHTQPDAKHKVLNLSAAETRATTWAQGERRNVKFAA